MTQNVKTQIVKDRIQEIELTPQGIIVHSDDAFLKIEEGSSIASIHPFFESTIPLLESFTGSLKFPCVNLDGDYGSKIIDVEFLKIDDKLILLLFDLTEHYEVSQPLVQEKNVASIAKNKLAFETQLLKAKEEFKNNFLANLNHEIRNPLNNLIGFMGLLKETKLTYDQNETLKVMMRTGTHIKVLMDDMLDISKIERGVLDIKEVNFNLGHLITNLQHHYQIKHHESEVSFEVKFENNVPRKLIGDPTRLNQILFNLLENAFRNTETGYVLLEVSSNERKKKHANISFTVSDSGSGIPEDQLNEIFDSYVQLQLEKIKPIGEGLGLKIVKDLTASLNGNIQVSSEQGKGSSFRCTLPFGVQHKEKTTKTIPKGSGIVMSKRILIVENETTNQMLFMKMFLNNEKGYVIEMAISGSHAMDLLQNNRYDLVILKSMLPDASAAELIETIRSQKKPQIATLPILIASGNTIKKWQEDVLKKGADSFLPKPFTKREMLGAIDQLLR